MTSSTSEMGQSANLAGLPDDILHVIANIITEDDWVVKITGLKKIHNYVQHDVNDLRWNPRLIAHAGTCRRLRNATMNNGISRCLKILGLKGSELVSALDVLGAERLPVTRFVVVISANNLIDALLTWMSVV